MDAEIERLREISLDIVSRSAMPGLIKALDKAKFTPEERVEKAYAEGFRSGWFLCLSAMLQRIESSKKDTKSIIKLTENW